MKEASGELNMSVVIIVAIGAMAAFFYFTLWPMIRTNMNQTANCSKAICNSCPSRNCKEVDCHMKGDTSHTFKCVWKG